MDPSVPLTIDQFRTDLPQFSDKTVYPDTSLQMWLDFGNLLLNPLRWGELLNYGLELFMAHNLSLQAYNTLKGGGSGGITGVTRGPIEYETVGPISLGYNTQAVVNKDAGWWNYTIYGQQFWWLAMMVGTGPIQVGAGMDVGYGYMGYGYGAAWPGPVTGMYWYR